MLKLYFKMFGCFFFLPNVSIIFCMYYLRNHMFF